MAYAFHEDKGKAAVYTKSEVDTLFSDADALYVKKYNVDAEQWDTSPRSGSVNPVTSAGIYNALNALNEKFLALYNQYSPQERPNYWDDTPTEGSTKPVTSDGIKDYVDTAVSSVPVAVDRIVAEGQYTTHHAVPGDYWDANVTWYWRRWTSGVAEAWAANRGTFWQLHQPWGGLWTGIHDAKQDLPYTAPYDSENNVETGEPVFSHVPAVFINSVTAGNFTWTIMGDIGSRFVTPYYNVATVSDRGEGYLTSNIFYYAVGRWD